MGADIALQNIRGGVLRGSLRGNLIVGSAIVITESLWLMHEYGWR